MMSKKPNKQNILVIAALFIVFVVPLIIAFYMYNHDIRWSNKTTNHGELLKPMIAIDALRIEDTKGQKISRADLHRIWWLLYFTNEPCEQVCKENLYKMQQVRLALGPKQEKLKCFVVALGSNNNDKLNNELKSTYTSIQLLNIYKRHSTIQYQSLYLVDPMGNLMMRYPENAEPKGILKDLKRLIHE